MSGKTLDKSKKFGVVVGSADGSLYYQDGACFDGDGQLVGAPPAVTPGPPVTDTAGGIADDIDEPGIRREELEGLHATKIAKLVEMEGLTLETGAGSKARNIENLLAAG